MFTDGEESAIREMLAEREIYKALMRYCRGSDRADVALIKSAYHPDATEQHGPYDGNAHAFADYGESFINGETEFSGGIKRHIHNITNFSVMFDDERRARVESTLFYVMQHLVDGQIVNACFCGRYHDIFTLRDEWRIEHRHMVLDHYFEVSETVKDTRLPGTFSPGSLSASDPVYAFLAEKAS